MYLSVEELRELTRRRQKSKMVAELQRRRIPHEVAWDGYPLVLESVVEARVNGNQTGRDRPNLAALLEHLGRRKHGSQKKAQSGSS